MLSLMAGPSFRFWYYPKHQAFDKIKNICDLYERQKVIANDTLQSVQTEINTRRVKGNSYESIRKERSSSIRLTSVATAEDDQLREPEYVVNASGKS